MGKLDGKVAFMTGVAHAVRDDRTRCLLAEEGADIIGVDFC